MADGPRLASAGPPRGMQPQRRVTRDTSRPPRVQQAGGLSRRPSTRQGQRISPPDTPSLAAENVYSKSAFRSYYQRKKAEVREKSNEILTEKIGQETVVVDGKEMTPIAALNYLDRKYEYLDRWESELSGAPSGSYFRVGDDKSIEVYTPGEIAKGKVDDFGMPAGEYASEVLKPRKEYIEKKIKQVQQAPAGASFTYQGESISRDALIERLYEQKQSLSSGISELQRYGSLFTVLPKEEGGIRITPSSRQALKQYGEFTIGEGEEKRQVTWRELKEEVPAAYIEYSREEGGWTVDVDIDRWYEESYERQRKYKGLRRATGHFLSSFANPSFVLPTMKAMSLHRSEFIADVFGFEGHAAKAHRMRMEFLEEAGDVQKEWEYARQQDIEEGELKGWAMSVGTSSPMWNIVIPAATGYGVGKVAGFLLSSAAMTSGTAATVGGKVAGRVATAAASHPVATTVGTYGVMGGVGAAGGYYQYQRLREAWEAGGGAFQEELFGTAYRGAWGLTGFRSGMTSGTAALHKRIPEEVVPVYKGVKGRLSGAKLEMTRGQQRGVRTREGWPASESLSRGRLTLRYKKPGLFQRVFGDVERVAGTKGMFKGSSNVKFMESGRTPFVSEVGSKIGLPRMKAMLFRSRSAGWRKGTSILSRSVVRQSPAPGDMPFTSTVATKTFTPSYSTGATPSIEWGTFLKYMASKRGSAQLVPSLRSGLVSPKPSAAMGELASQVAPVFQSYGTSGAMAAVGAGTMGILGGPEEIGERIRQPEDVVFPAVERRRGRQPAIVPSLTSVVDVSRVSATGQEETSEVSEVQASAMAQMLAQQQESIQQSVSTSVGLGIAGFGLRGGGGGGYGGYPPRRRRRPRYTRGKRKSRVGNILNLFFGGGRQ